MTIKTRLRHLYRRTKRQMELKRLDSIPYDLAHLNDISKINLADILHAQQSNQEWATVEEQIYPIGISNNGGSNAGDSRAVYYLLRYLRPKAILEIGTCLGATLARMCVATQMLKSEQEFTPKIVTVDIVDVNTTSHWSGQNRYSPRENIERLGSSSFVTFVMQSSQDYLASTEEKFDLIFLDGNHIPSAIYQDIVASMRLLNPGGWILLHDYYPKGQPLFDGASAIYGPFLAVQRLQAEGAHIQALPFGNLPWWTRSNSSMTSLALLGAEPS